VTTDRLTDEQFIAEIRAMYDDVDHHGNSLVPFGQIKKTARRHHIRQVAGATLAVAGLSAVAAAAVGGFSPGRSSNDSNYTAPMQTATQSTASQASGQQSVSPTTLNGTADNLYAVLDASPSYGFFMLQTDVNSGTITIWRRTDVPPESDASLRQVASSAGVTLDLRPLPDDSQWDPSARADTLGVVANQIRAAVDADPSYGMNLLKIEVPLNTVIVWRSSPNRATDMALVEIAQSAGAQIELRTAAYSREELTLLGRQIAAENQTWQSFGFTVNGADPRPTGALIVVRGDVDAAVQHLPAHAWIIGVELDDGHDAPAISPAS
jgi:hypothetical protein